MKKTTWLLRIIGTIQIILGLLYLIAPGMMLQSMGHSAPEADIYYPLGMLASRFLAYGAAFYYISSNPAAHKPWIYFMVVIQLIDLGVGVFYTATGVISLELSGFALFNATWIIVFLLLWMPKSQSSQGS